MWCPELHQITKKRNDNYLQSLWIGFCMPLLLLPKVLFYAFIMPIFLALARGVLELVKVCVYLPTIGLLGYASGKNIEIPPMSRVELIELELSPEDALKLITMIQARNEANAKRQEEEGGK